LRPFDILLNDRFISAAFGLAGGLVATFVAPWVIWCVERRKLQHQARTEKIAGWRAMILRVSNQANDDFGTLYLELHRDVDYLSLVPHLSNATHLILNSGGATDQEVFGALLADIASIEKEWKIL
jgi:hypothetical protein